MLAFPRVLWKPFINSICSSMLVASLLHLFVYTLHHQKCETAHRVQERVIYMSGKIITLLYWSCSEFAKHSCFKTCDNKRSSRLIHMSCPVIDEPHHEVEVDQHPDSTDSRFRRFPQNLGGVALKLPKSCSIADSLNSLKPANAYA